MILNDLHPNLRLNQSPASTTILSITRGSHQFLQLIVQLLLVVIQSFDDHRSVRRTRIVPIHLQIGDVRVFLTQFPENLFLSEREINVEQEGSHSY